LPPLKTAQKALRIVNRHGLDLVIAYAGLLEGRYDVAEDIRKGPVGNLFFLFFRQPAIPAIAAKSALRLLFLTTHLLFPSR
jgi:hypothetical protein